MSKMSDTSVGTVCITYSVDIPRYWHDRIGVAEMITWVLCTFYLYSARVYCLILVKLHSCFGTSKSSEYRLTIA